MLGNSLKYKKHVLKSTVFSTALLLSSNNLYAHSEACYDLGSAANKANVFVEDTTTLSNTEVTGRLFSGGKTKLKNFGLGNALTDMEDLGPVLIAGDDDDDKLHWKNGTAFNGDVVYAGETKLTRVDISNGRLIEDDPIDFYKAGDFLKTLSTDLAALPSTGDTWGKSTGDGGHIILNVWGKDPVNVFTVSGQSLKNAVTLNVHAPKTSTVIINFEGVYDADTEYMVNQMSFMGIHLKKPDRTNVLYNFPDAEKLTLEGISIEGTILAPFAHVEFNNGQINGKLIAHSLEGSGEAHDVAFTGCLPE